MAWKDCLICSEVNADPLGCLTTILPSLEGSSQNGTRSKFPNRETNFHEPDEHRKFRITIVRICSPLLSIGNLEDGNAKQSKRNVDFYVDLYELSRSCPFFEKYLDKDAVEFETNCISTTIMPSQTSSKMCSCELGPSTPLRAQNFHAFLEAVCASNYAIRPSQIDQSNVVPVLDILSHFACEPALTSCERFLMKANLAQFDPLTLVNLLGTGMNVCLDHKILARILCVCLMNTSKLADVSQELTGNVGSLFSQAFVAHSTKGFKHVKPLEQDNVCPAVRDLIRNNAGLCNGLNEGAEEDGKKAMNSKKKRKKRNGCDHAEESFECILCFDTRCSKCKGEGAFCFKAIDNFLYQVRLQLFPHTYRAHLDREFLREGCINNYLLRHQLLPLPNI